MPLACLVLALCMVVVGCSRERVLATERNRTLTDSQAAVLTLDDLPDMATSGPGLAAGPVWRSWQPVQQVNGPRLGARPFVHTTIEVYSPGDAERLMQELHATLRSNLTQVLEFPDERGAPVHQRVYLWDEDIPAVGDDRLAVAFEAASGERGYLIAVRWGDVVGYLRHVSTGVAPSAPDLDETKRLVKQWDAKVSRLLVGR